MRHDLEGRSLRTEADVDVYCFQVAGTVGVVMAAILGSDDFEVARPAAAALGMAMQRTNIPVSYTHLTLPTTPYV